MGVGGEGQFHPTLIGEAPVARDQGLELFADDVHQGAAVVQGKAPPLSL